MVGLSINLEYIILPFTTSYKALDKPSVNEYPAIAVGEHLHPPGEHGAQHVVMLRQRSYYGRIK